MSSPFPAEGGNPFELLFSQLGQMFRSSGPVNWDLARQFSQWSAAEGTDLGNVEPLERIRLEELVKVADLHVADVTGLPTSSTGRVVTVRPVTRADWAVQTLEAWKPLLGALAGSLNQAAAEGSAPQAPGGPGAGADEEDLAGGLEGMLRPLMPGLQAAFLGLQFGSMLGSMAQRALGQYDLPIPRPPGDELLVVAQNVTAFAADWSLSADDVRLWVCLSEVTHHAVLARPSVRSRLEELLTAYVSGFDPSAASLEDRLADVDPSDPSSLERVLGDPAALLGEIQSDEQRRLLPQLASLLAVIEGYVDHVVDEVGRRLIGSHGPLTEALRRRRVERGQGERMVERLLGVELRQEQYDRGTSFIRGVVERAGREALSQLWTLPHALPTPSEVEAPGLWLERISLPGN
ncbi:MAG TPA: zinc-dependent metalloprotease [Acidimicrobiales bacterium]|nr:zinc-dependent metalloprotease [Acidimicrobiales bacterium]